MKSYSSACSAVVEELAAAADYDVELWSG